MQEKAASEYVEAHSGKATPRVKGSGRVMPLLVTSLVVGLLLRFHSAREIGAPGLVQEQSSTTADPESVWNVIPGSTADSLLWMTCYLGAQCARMMVPLDYSNPDGAQAGVAIVKVPSRFAPNEEGYRGPILFNPGGPGGSGVDMIRSIGQSLQKLIGDEYDIVGFDPRGVARTTPQVIIFPDEAEDAAWRLKYLEDPAPNSTVDAIARIYSKAHVYGAVANVTAKHSAPYVSTAIVARDMLNIARAHGRDMLQYWGFSYGTILGSTFAAMFPDHVERMVIDGVADVENFFTGTWTGALHDTDKTLRIVLEACVAAGPELCALYEKTADDVHARLTSIYNGLKRRPLPFYDSTGENYGILSYKAARNSLFKLLYAPYGKNERYPSMELLNALAEVQKDNGLALARIAGLAPSRSPFKCACPRKPRRPVSNRLDTQSAIACADAGPRSDTLDDMEHEFLRMSELSEFADMWSISGQCSGWQLRAAERFTGPFVGDTAYPILLIGNTADPVTPILHARRISTGFNNSIMLQQDSGGHCSIAATSFCTAKAIRDYFRDGTLPKNGTVCGISNGIFPRAPADMVVPLSAEDQVVMHAWADIRDSFDVPLLSVGL